MATHSFLGMPAVIESDAMIQLMSVVERAAKSSATVLITGESGSGKELVARAIHHYSMRAAKPWVDLSCAALPEHLLESELFGYDRGAFSGADSAKPGLFELANQGTLFLDEIGELEIKMQVKLLRVLDGVPYYRLGGIKKVSVDVRVVAATNQNLEAATGGGRFRNDLYHRLSQITLRVPPLRERREDIVALARHFLRAYEGLSFSDAALRAMESYGWPGNIRELRNSVIHAAVMAQGPIIQASHLQLGFGGGPQFGGMTNGLANLSAQIGLAEKPSAPAPASGSLDGMERRMIFEALQATNGHQQKAAARLGISRRTLSRKLKCYASASAESSEVTA